MNVYNFVRRYEPEIVLAVYAGITIYSIYYFTKDFFIDEESY